MSYFSADSFVLISIITTIFTGLVSLVAAIGGAISAVIATKNGRKLDEVHQATNGMKAELVKENGERMYAKGLLKGERRMPSTSGKQKRFMAAAAHDKGFAKKAGIPQKVAKEYNRADSGKGPSKPSPGKKRG